MKEDSEEDSAIEDANTESLKSRPRSVQVPPPGSEILEPQVFPVRESGPRLSPPTNMRSGKVQVESSVSGISQLRAAKSPVRNLFTAPAPAPAKAQSRSSTLVDAESLTESSEQDQSKSRVIPSCEVFSLHLQINHSGPCLSTSRRPPPSWRILTRACRTRSRTSWPGYTRTASTSVWTSLNPALFLVSTNMVMVMMMMMVSLMMLIFVRRKSPPEPQ